MTLSDAPCRVCGMTSFVIAPETNGAFLILKTKCKACGAFYGLDKISMPNDMDVELEELGVVQS